ncbi:MAG: TonB-dependent receptor [Alphaproteobacteria bacterium]|nr:TonB-dependent receptor [Alphaproteobacteria bacterium]
MVHRLAIPVLSGGLLVPTAVVRAQDAASGGDDAAGAEVVVQTARDPRPTAATVVPVDASRPASDELADWLEAVPGASVRRLGGLGTWSGVSLRGSSFRQVTILLDGVPLNPDGIDAVDLAELPVALVGALHVYRGRVPARIGLAPIGGVVDVVTRPAAAPARVTVGGGSYGTGRLSASGGGVGTPGGVPVDGFGAVDLLAARGRYPYLDDHGTPYVTADDTTALRRNADRAQASALGRVRVGGDDLQGTLLDGVVVRDEGLPGPIGAPTAHATLRTVRNLAVARLGWQRGAGAGGLDLWHLLRSERLDDRDAELGGAGAWQRDLTHTLGLTARASGAMTPWLAIEGSARATFGSFQRTPLDTGVAEDAAQRWVVGGAVDLRFSAWRGLLVVVPGVDVTGIVPSGAAADVADAATGAVNPGLTVQVDPGAGVTLTATGGRAFRPPDLTELYGDRGALVGNPDLRPESAWQGDLSVRWGGGDVVVGGVEAAGFARRVADRITWVQNAQRTLVPVNFGAAFLAGGEVAASAEVPGWALARLGVALTRSVNLTDDPAQRGLPLPFVPVFAIDHLLAVGWGDRLRLGWTLHATAGVPTDAVGLRWQAPRVLHGLTLRVQPTRRWPALAVDVRNVGNARTASVPADPLRPDGPTVRQPLTDVTGYPLPGATVMVTVSWTPPGDT